MTVCERCDRTVTADITCVLANCPHQGSVASPPVSHATAKKADIAVVSYEDEAPPPKPEISADGSACGQCGTQNMRGAKFCAGCGTPLGTPISDAAEPIAQYDSVIRDPAWRTKGFALAAVIIIGLLAYLAFGGDEATKNNIAADAATEQAAPAEPLGQERTMWVVADANVRDRATAQGSKLLDKLPRGTKIDGVMQIGEDGKSQWFRLTDNRGYVGGVNLSQTEPPKLAKPLADQTWYAPDSVAILALPDANSPKIATLTPGQMVKLAGITENGFAEAKMGRGGVGYIAPGGYDFSISKRVATPADLEAFYGMMGMANSANSSDYSGSASDQSISLTVWAPYSSSVHGRAIYQNQRTGNTCWSSLQLIGRDEKGRFRFSQSSDPGGPACKMSPDLVLSHTGSYMNAWWLQGSDTLMSAKLVQM